MDDAKFGFTHREKKALAPRKKEPMVIEEYKFGLVVLALILLATLIIHFFIEPKDVKAQTVGPMTNKEVCQALEKGEYYIPAGQITKTVTLCKKEGITI